MPAFMFLRIYEDFKIRENNVNKEGDWTSHKNSGLRGAISREKIERVLVSFQPAVYNIDNSEVRFSRLG